MKRALPRLAVIALVFCALPLRADFDALARTVERRSGAKRIWIPFFGVARFVVHVSHPKGVHDVKLATFEGGSFRAPVLDASDVLGEGFRPLVQVQSKRAGESTLVYARPADGDLMTLLILNVDASDTTLVEVTMDAERVARELAKEEGFHSNRW
ncbi:MAG: hypothetical protein JWO56_86 [Acidobacteria bacterium]|nr:hypothetical protein [Acidobacteriota bacterium]